LKTSTVNAAKVIGRMSGKGDFGGIEVGKRADMKLVINNPLEDVANLKKLRAVMVIGRWYDKSQLQ